MAVRFKGETMFRTSAVQVHDQSRERVAQVLHENELNPATAFVNAVYDDLKKAGGNFTDDAAILRSAQRQRVPADPDAEYTWDAGFVRKPHFNTSASRDIIRT